MLTKLLFESPVLLPAVLVAIELTLIAAWWRRRSSLCARLMGVGLAAVLTLPFVSHLVVTQRERIIALCHELARALESGDVATIRGHLSADFEAGGLDRVEFADHVAHTLLFYRILDPQLRNFRVTFPDEHVGVAVFDASARVESAEGWGERLPSRWRVTLGVYGDSWEVAGVVTLPVPPLNARSVRALFR